MFSLPCYAHLIRRIALGLWPVMSARRAINFAPQALVMYNPTRRPFSNTCAGTGVSALNASPSPSRRCTLKARAPLDLRPFNVASRHHSWYKSHPPQSFTWPGGVAVMHAYCASYRRIWYVGVGGPCSIRGQVIA